MHSIKSTFNILIICLGWTGAAGAADQTRLSSPPTGEFQQHDCNNCSVELEPLVVLGARICLTNARICTILKPLGAGRWQFQMSLWEELGMEHLPVEVQVLGQLTDDGWLSVTTSHRDAIPETNDWRWRHGQGMFHQTAP